MTSATALPAPSAPGAAVQSLTAALAAHDGPVPSTVRREALAGMEDAVAELKSIAGGSSASGGKVFPGVQVQAIKLLADIAAVRSSASLPRDVVNERCERTRAFLLSRLGEAAYATLADGLTEIWDV